MADENYQIDIGLNITGDEQVKTKLKATEKFMEQTRKRAQILNKMKISPAVKIIDRFSAPAKKVTNMLRKIGKTTAAATVKMKDLFSSQAPKVWNQIRSLGNTTITIGIKAKNMMGNVLGKLTSPLALLGGGLGGGLFVKNMLDASGFEEQAKISLKVMLKSKKLADSVFGQAKHFADITPFDTQDVVASTSSLVSARFGVNDILKGGLLRDIGDLTAANGDINANIRDVTAVFARLKAGDFGEAFERLRDFKINKQDLMDMGLVFSKSGEFQGTAEQAVTAVRKVIQKNFGGMMEEQSKSWAGLWSTFTSNVTNAFAAIGKYEVRSGVTVLDLFKNRIKQLTSLIVDDEGKLTKNAQKFVRGLGEAFNWVDKQIGKVFRHIKVTYLDNPKFQKLNFSGKIDFILNDIGSTINDWLKNGGQDKINNVTKKMLTIISEALTKAGPEILQIGTTIGLALGEGILRGLESALKNQARVASVPLIGPYLVNMKFMKSLGMTAWNDYQNDKKSKKAQKHALGGLFSRPHLGMVAERGPEAIIPLSASMRGRGRGLWQQTGLALGMAGGGNITVSGNSFNFTTEVDEDALALRIGKEILRSIKQSTENR